MGDGVLPIVLYFAYAGDGVLLIVLYCAYAGDGVLPIVLCTVDTWGGREAS